MILVRRILPFADAAETDGALVWLDDATPAVAAVEPYIHLDGPDGPGAITRGDIHEADIRPLGSYVIGDEVYVESPDPDDFVEIDDEGEYPPPMGRIWWRARVVEP